MIEIFFGSCLFAGGVAFGSYVTRTAMKPVSEMMSSQMSSQSATVLSLSDALVKISEQKAPPPLPTEKSKALFIGPDNKAYTGDEFERVERRMTTVVDDLLTSIEASEARAKEMMQ